MKLKVKITGWTEGKRCSFRTTIETPDFEDKHWEFMGHHWFQPARERSIEWLDDNYEEIIVPLAEERFYFPIEGYEVVSEVNKVNKRQLVIEYAEVLLKDWSVEMKEIFLVSLTKQWPQIKGQSIENIFKIVFNTIDVSTAVSMKHLREINRILSGTKSDSNNSTNLLGS